MANKKVNGETPFQVIAHSFAVSASESGYTLNYSADGETWSEWSTETPANEVCFVISIPKFCYFKLVGNSGDVTITY